MVYIKKKNKVQCSHIILLFTIDNLLLKYVFLSHSLQLHHLLHRQLYLNNKLYKLNLSYQIVVVPPNCYFHRHNLKYTKTKIIT